MAGETVEARMGVNWEVIRGLREDLTRPGWNATRECKAET